VVDSNKGGGLNKRRGISTIVGAAIFLVLFASATSTFFIAMDSQRDTINSQRAISDAIMEKTKEKFSIAASVDETNGNLLGIQVKNLGTNPVEIDDIWIVNKSGSFPAKKYLIDYKDSVIPPGYGSNILENTRLTMLPDDYDIKVVSTLGTIQKSEFNVGGNNYLRSTLLAIPPDVKINKNVTLTMHVENIGTTKLLNVKPFYDVPNISTPLDPPIPPTPTPVDLDPGESVFFTWQYTVKANGLVAGNKVTFDNYAEATIDGMPPTTVKSNDVKESIKLLEPDLSEIIVLTDDLLSRPEMFMIFPSPFGDVDSADPGQGLFGMNVVNPTAQTIKVSKVVISAFTPQPSSNNRYFGLSCSPNNIYPPTGFWECPIENQLAWHKGAGPTIDIPPFSVSQFLVKVSPDDLPSSTTDIESMVIHGNVFTSLGQFGKAGYGSSIDNENAIVNVFLSTGYELFGNNEIFSSVSGIQSGIPRTFYATIVNFHNDPSFAVKNAEFIINVPKGWSQPTISRSDGFISVNVIPNPDSSHQIIGTLDSADDISGTLGDESRTIEFVTTPPVITNTQMYVMYMLADGNTGNGWRLGPLTEVVLQVVP
jgi:archaellum component FlaF (FlaF/FlaG flagellin family)